MFNFSSQALAQPTAADELVDPPVDPDPAKAIARSFIEAGLDGRIRFVLELYAPQDVLGLAALVTLIVIVYILFRRRE